MEPITGGDIRAFRIRGNYFNQRSLLSRKNLHYSQRDVQVLPRTPGYSPPVVEFETASGLTGTIAVSEVDIPLLCDEDLDAANKYLALILQARGGDAQAAKELLAATQTHPFLAGTAELRQAQETEFVVPSTSTAKHTEQDISQKGFILLKLSQMGYPVPDFVVLTAQCYRDGERLERHIAEGVEQLEMLTMQSFGDSKDPLVIAMRCATGDYIPGVMDTYLNVGITERTLPRLERMYGPEVAHKMFLNNLRNLCAHLACDDSAALVSAVTSDLAPAEVVALIDRLLETVRKKQRGLVEDPLLQAAFFARQAYRHVDEDYDLLATLCRNMEPLPSLILQKMVCTVRHDDAYAGVICSRNTQTGVGVELQTARNIFGEEMMTGSAEVESTSFEDREKIKDTFPAVYHFVPHLTELEQEFESPVTIEFAVEATSRYQWFALLQLNETGMAGRAAITCVVDLHKAGAISRKRVTELIRPYHIKQLTSDSIDQDTFTELQPFCTGVAVLPRSAVSARVYFTGDAALRAKSRGEKVCLCKRTFVPTDTVVMREMDAIISLTSVAIHVVTICQSLGIPALLSLEKHGASLYNGGDRLVNAIGTEIEEGDWITISSRRRVLYQGRAKYQPARLLRFMGGEPVDIADDEKKTFESVAYAYRYYLQLVRGMKVDQIANLNEVTRLVNFDLRGESQEAVHLVNSWFDDREIIYMEEVLKSDIGDHLGQSNVFNMLTLDRKIRFFKRALAKCYRERISGYEAGAFMLGRFLSQRYPVAFWRAFSPQEIGLLVNEWVLFEKYIALLHSAGERKVLQARKKILKEGLHELRLHPGALQMLIPLKLSGAPLEEARGALPEWSDAQTVRVFDILQQPYSVFFDFSAKWSIGELEKICTEENLALPGPNDA